MVRVVGGFKPFSWACFDKDGVAVCSFDSDVCKSYIEDLYGSLVFRSCCCKDSDGKLLWVCPRYDADFAVLLKRYFPLNIVKFYVPSAVSSGTLQK